MSGQIVPEMAALAERPEVGWIPVGRIMVEMGGGNHHPHPAHRGGIAWPRFRGELATPVAPDLALRIEPTTIRQGADQPAVRPAAGLAAPAGAIEPNGVAD